jgi:hypothetical protein
MKHFLAAQYPPRTELTPSRAAGLTRDAKDKEGFKPKQPPVQLIVVGKPKPKSSVRSLLKENQPRKDLEAFVLSATKRDY